MTQKTNLMRLTRNQGKQLERVRFHRCDECPNRGDCEDYRGGQECALSQRLLPELVGVYMNLPWITPEDHPSVHTLCVMEIALAFMAVRGEQNSRGYRDTAKEVRMLRRELALTPSSRLRHRKQKVAERGAQDIWGRD